MWYRCGGNGFNEAEVKLSKGRSELVLWNRRSQCSGAVEKFGSEVLCCIEVLYLEKLRESLMSF